MKASTKENLGNIFGSLISNQRAINGAKRNPWWAALIMFVLAIILPVIPLTVTVANSYGASFLAGNTYGYESQITEASLDLYVDGYKFEVTDYNYLTATKDGVELNSATYNDTVAISTVHNTVTNEIDFEVYFSYRTFAGNSGIKSLVDELLKVRYQKNTTIQAPAGTENSEDATYYRPSFIILFPEGSYEYVAKAKTYDMAAQQSGDWKNTPVGTNLLESVLTVEGYTLPTTADEAEALLRNGAYVSGVLNNWKTIYNQAYIATKNNSLLFQSLLFLGIYALLVLFMGLMIFLLTRGKKNPFNYLNIWVCEKIAMWASLCPGILAMILGFMLSNYAVMFFIILVGIRTMWLTMKQLRPQYN